MRPTRSSSLRWILAAGVVAGVLWLLLRTETSPPAPRGNIKRAMDFAAATSEKRASPETATKALALAGGANSGPAAVRWIDTVDAITDEDRKARAERIYARVTLARLQRDLAAAPVPPENMGRLLDLMSYKLNLRPEFARKCTASGLPTSGPEYERLYKLEAERVDAEIKGLVGETHFLENKGAFGRFDDRLYGLEFIGEALAQGDPLTVEQRGALNELLEKLDPNLTRGKGEEAPDPQTGLTSYDLEVGRELGRVASLRQTQIFLQVRADWNRFQEDTRRRSAKGMK